MAISRTLLNTKFLYFLIIFLVLVTTFHMFNLVKINPRNHNHQGGDWHTPIFDSIDWYTPTCALKSCTANINCLNCLYTECPDHYYECVNQFPNHQGYGLPVSTKGTHFVNLTEQGKQTSASKVTNDEKTNYEISLGHFDKVYDMSIRPCSLASSKTNPETSWTISNFSGVIDYREAEFSRVSARSNDTYVDYEYGSYDKPVFFNEPVDHSYATHSYVGITVVFMCAMILTLVIVLFKYYLCKHKRQNDEEDQITDQGLTETAFKSCSPRPFTFEELSLATNNFHQDHILGKGGFGAVFKAVFPNGQTVAVKRVSSTSQQGIKEYKAEVTIVSRSNHRHLVQLIGWCHEIKGELLLVYELMENKSLDVHLFDPRLDSLGWSVRYNIAQGLAKALRYLHEECGQQAVLHMDIKSSNVLLDSNFEPKLGDFGLSKLVDHDKSMELSVMAGTRGYLAPECVLTGKVSTHSDVYSFGVVALELATGRKTIDPTAEEDQKVLVKWVQNLYKADKVLEAVDPKLGDDYKELQVKGLIVVGLWCVLHDFRARPSMREIVRILNNTQDPLLDLHIPTLVPDPVPFDFDSIRETSFRSLDLIVPMEIENPIRVDPMVLSSGDTVRSEDEDQTYPTLFMWRHISVLHLWRYLMGVMWFRSSHNG